MDLSTLTGTCRIPLYMNDGGRLVDIGTVEVDLDLRSLQVDEEGRLFAVVDLHAEQGPNE